jgi:hypothetical protein
MKKRELVSKHEEKIHEKYGSDRDTGIFRENLSYIEECCSRYIYLCERKGIEPNIEKRPIERCRKEDFFKNIKEVVDESIEEEEYQEKMFSQLKGVNDVKKKIMIQWM